ncbi:hypothetical protein P154DRAFT_422079, partial [Amniculicola lignicola CBS 123094]
GLKLALITFGLYFSDILAGLDFILITIAIPVITSDFDSPKDVGWYGRAYFGTSLNLPAGPVNNIMCVTLPLAGKIYTFFPKKLVYLACIGVFEPGSFVCALASNSSALIIGRAISGLDASGIFAGRLSTTFARIARRTVQVSVLIATFCLRCLGSWSRGWIRRTLGRHLLSCSSLRSTDLSMTSGICQHSIHECRSARSLC